MKKIAFILFCLVAVTVGNAQEIADGLKDSEKIDVVLNNWHKAAADAKQDAYFGAMTGDAVFIGTDPTEHWSLAEFKRYAKPYFDAGKAWNLKPVKRIVHVEKGQPVAWFEELLDTDMGICRGSGVLRKESGKWKIAQYVLSMTVPNDNTKEVTKTKSVFDSAYLKTLAGSK